MKNNCRNLNIYGQGTSSGGKFKDVNIKGSGQIHGDLECVNVKVYGDGLFDGKLEVIDTVNIKGHTEFKGPLETENLKIQGEIEINNEVFADDTSITGYIQTDNDFNAEIFKLEGGFNIGGLLNADKIKINLYWPCKVDEIGCAEITVKKNAKLSFLGLKNMIMPSETNKILDAKIIEGDYIYLENTHAKVVRGNKITIGTGCKIDLVEYKESYENKEKSIVDKYKKI